ncbi:MAG: family acetyltransferase [Humibacillus sp.]|nr:family acetyltransferase [Humibacillus sp.]
METELRPLTADDWDVLREIRLRALSDSPEAFGGTLAQSLSQPEDFWRGRLSGPGITVVAVEASQTVAMGGAYVPDEGHASVWGMWTDPESRGRGVGSLVLDHLLAWCRPRGLAVELRVVEGNPLARGLYTSRGFRPTGERELLREGCETYAEVLVLEHPDQQQHGKT